MNLSLSEIFSLSLFIPGILSLLRFPRIAPTFYPFIYLLWIGMFNELLSIVLLQLNYYSVVNNNIYVLLESLLLLWLFRKQEVFEAYDQLYYFLVASFAIFWITENLVTGRLTQISSYFRIYYSFVVVLISITSINQLIVGETQSLMKNAFFALCCCFIVFFAYKVLIEIFWVVGLNSSKSFRVNVYTIFMYLNLLINLVFALIILWIPRKRAISLLSS